MISKIGEILKTETEIEPKDLDNQESSKLTNWKNEPTFKDLNRNYQDAQKDHDLVLDKLEERRINMDGGAPINSPQNKSRARPRLIRKQAEWKYPALEEPFMSTENLYNVSPRTFEDVDSASQNEIILNYQWNVQIKKSQFVNDVVRTIYDDGTAIVKIGWEMDEDVVEIEEEVPVYASPEESITIFEEQLASGSMSQEQVDEMINNGEPAQLGTEMITRKKRVLVKNQPTYEVCDTRNVVLDPTSNGKIDKLRFIVYEYDTTYSDLKKEEYKRQIEIDEATGEKTIIEYGIYKNLDNINFENSYSERNKYQYDDEYVSSFEFSDKPRKKLRAYEYWGYWDINGKGETQVIVATWIGDTIIRMEESPFPFNGLPFAISRYLPKKGELYGETDGDLLIENQEAIGRMKRAAYDITADAAVGQEFIDEQFFSSPSQKDNYKSGRTVYFRHGMNPSTSIHKTKINEVPRAIFDMISMENNDAESLTGTKSFSSGIGSNAFGSVAAGIRSTLDATSKRELSILRRISEELFVDIGKKTIQMNQVFLEEETVVRLTNKEFTTINKQDIVGEFDLKLSISTPESDNEKAEKLNMMMQTNGNSMNPNLSKIIFAKIAKLWKQPDLEQEILSFEPAPDPIAEQLKQLQLENAQLENKKLQMEIARMVKDIEAEDSKIYERNSRTAQNLASESEENLATARLRNAQAAEIEANTDLNNLEFINIKNGTKRKEKIEDIELQHLSKLELAELKHNKSKEKKQPATIDNSNLTYGEEQWD